MTFLDYCQNNRWDDLLLQCTCKFQVKKICYCNFQLKQIVKCKPKAGQHRNYLFNCLDPKYSLMRLALQMRMYFAWPHLHNQVWFKKFAMYRKVVKHLEHVYTNTNIELTQPYSSSTYCIYIYSTIVVRGFSLLYCGTVRRSIILI